MKKIIIFITSFLLISCALIDREDRVETIDVYAVAIPFLTNDVDLHIEYSDTGKSFGTEVYFIPLKIESTIKYYPSGYIHSPGDITYFNVRIPNGFIGVSDQTNELSFAGYTAEYPEFRIRKNEEFEPEWFMTEVGTIAWKGSNVTVYRLATLEEFNENLSLANKIYDGLNPYPINYVDIGVSTQHFYTNDITTNHYVVDLRNKPEALWEMTNHITVDSNTFALMEALGDAYYPQSGKLYLTIDGWPDWPW